jgi:hypothetical protein
LPVCNIVLSWSKKEKLKTIECCNYLEQRLFR